MVDSAGKRGNSNNNHQPESVLGCMYFLGRVDGTVNATVAVVVIVVDFHLFILCTDSAILA